MANNRNSFLEHLRNSDLDARCPNCNCEFRISSTTLFDGLGKFPKEVQQKQLEMIKSLREKSEELKKKRFSADVTSERMAVASGLGKIIEKVLPAYRDFNQPIADCRALFEPVDLIIFKGCCNLNVNWITFMDIKTGNGNLNDHQKMIKKVVEKKNVKCEMV